MPVIPKKARFQEILRAVRDADGSRAAEVLRAVTILPEPDPLELRGPSYTSALKGGVPLGPPPPMGDLVVIVTYNNGAALPGAAVRIYRKRDSAVATIANGTTDAAGVATFKLITTDYYARATADSVKAETYFILGPAGLTVTLSLALAPPQPPPPPPEPKPPIRLGPIEPILTESPVAPPTIVPPPPPPPPRAYVVGDRVVVFGTVVGTISYVSATGVYVVEPDPGGGPTVYAYLADLSPSTA